MFLLRRGLTTGVKRGKSAGPNCRLISELLIGAKVKYLHTSCFTSIVPLDGNGRATLSLLGLEGGVEGLNRTRAVAVVFIVVGRAAVGAGARAGHYCG